MKLSYHRHKFLSFCHSSRVWQMAVEYKGRWTIEWSKVTKLTAVCTEQAQQQHFVLSTRRTAAAVTTYTLSARRSIWAICCSSPSPNYLLAVSCRTVISTILSRTRILSNIYKITNKYTSTVVTNNGLRVLNGCCWKGYIDISCRQNDRAVGLNVNVVKLGRTSTTKFYIVKQVCLL